MDIFIGIKIAEVGDRLLSEIKRRRDTPGL